MSARKEPEAVRKETQYAEIRVILATALIAFAREKSGKRQVDIKTSTLGKINHLGGSSSQALDLFEIVKTKPKLVETRTPQELIKEHWPTPGEVLTARLEKQFNKENITSLTRYQNRHDLDPKITPGTKAYRELFQLMKSKKQLTASQRLIIVDTSLYLRKHDHHQFSKKVTDARITEFIMSTGNSKKERLEKAGLLYQWLKRTHREDVRIAKHDKTIVYSSVIFNEPRFSKILAGILLPKDYDDIGRRLHTDLITGRKDISSFVNDPYFKSRGYTPDAVAAIVRTYRETGYVNVKDNGQMTLTADGRAAAALSGDEIEATRIAWRIKNNSYSEKLLPMSLAEGIQIQEAWNKKISRNSPCDIQLKTDKPPVILSLKDLLLGYSGSDPKYILESLDALLNGKSSPRPDIAIISGPMYGEYKNSKSDLRARTIKTLDQFRMTKLLIDKLHEAGIYTIVNASLEDAWLARDMTIDMLFLMQTFNKEAETSHISYWRQNNLMTREGDAYDHLLFDFCSKIAIPYFMQIGRSPLDSEGVNIATNHQMHIPELFVLYDAWDKLTNGKSIPKDYLSIIKPEYIPMLGQKINGLAFTYGLNLKVTTAKGDFTIWDVHDLSLTGIPQPFTTTDKTEEYIRSKVATGQPVPDLITTGHDSKFVLMRTPGNEKGKGVWLASDPAPLTTTDPIKEDYTRFSMSKDRGKRKINSGEYNTPSNVRYQLEADGSLSVDLDTARFRFLADLMEEDIRVLIFGDQQTGSQTGDIAAYTKLLWVATHQLPTLGSTYLYDLGDNTQGDRLYKNFHAEGGLMTGLARQDHQALLFSLVSERATAEIDPKVIDNLKVFHRVIGNHQWLNDPMYPAFGAYLTNAYLAHNIGRTFEEGLDKARVIQQLKTEVDGVIPLMHSAFEQIGPYGLYLTHRFVEKNQKAGGKGKHPIHMAYPFEKGLAGELSTVNFIAMGDMHIPGITEYNGRYYAIVPPLAKGSPYERRLALNGAIPGALEIQLGRKKIPRFTFWSYQRINDITISSGPLSDERLADEHGLKTHLDYDPLTSHLYDPDSPKSALQQWILKETTTITRRPDSTLPSK